MKRLLLILLVFLLISPIVSHASDRSIEERMDSLESQMAILIEQLKAITGGGDALDDSDISDEQPAAEPAEEEIFQGVTVRVEDKFTLHLYTYELFDNITYYKTVESAKTGSAPSGYFGGLSSLSTSSMRSGDLNEYLLLYVSIENLKTSTVNVQSLVKDLYIRYQDKYTMNGTILNINPDFNYPCLEVVSTPPLVEARLGFVFELPNAVVSSSDPLILYLGIDGETYFCELTN